jgi:hypothetical protein
MIDIREELRTFSSLQEEVLKSHDKKKGKSGWKTISAQTLASNLIEGFGEVITNIFGQDQVCDFLLASLRDHVEESGVDVEYDFVKTQRKLADTANMCMMLHDIAKHVTPYDSNREKTADE